MISLLARSLQSPPHRTLSNVQRISIFSITFNVMKLLMFNKQFYDSWIEWQADVWAGGRVCTDKNQTICDGSAAVAAILSVHSSWCCIYTCTNFFFSCRMHCYGFQINKQYFSLSISLVGVVSQFHFIIFQFEICIFDVVSIAITRSS